MLTRFSKKVFVGFLALSLAGAPALADDDDDEQELTLEQLPSQVRATVESEARGGQIDEIEMETGKDGKVRFEVEIRKGGEKLEVVIAADGAVLERKVERRKRK